MIPLSILPMTTYQAAQECLCDALSSGLISGLLEDADEREFLARDAYVHPNGFWKVRLHGASLGKMQVRLHYWPTGSEKGDIHDHGWAYASLGLRGAGTEDIYVEGIGGVATAFSYRPGADGGFDLGRSHRETQISLDCNQPIQRGQYSGGEASHIHTFTAKGGSDLLTVVATGEPVVKFSRVFVPGRVERLQSLRPAPLTRDQIDSMVADARRSLEGVA